MILEKFSGSGLRRRSYLQSAGSASVVADGLEEPITPLLRTGASHAFWFHVDSENVLAV